MTPSSQDSFLNNETGATAIEYAFIASMIAMAIVGILILLGADLQGAYQRVVNMF